MGPPVPHLPRCHILHASLLLADDGGWSHEVLRQRNHHQVKKLRTNGNKINMINMNCAASFLGLVGAAEVVIDILSTMAFVSDS